MFCKKNIVAFHDGTAIFGGCIPNKDKSQESGDLDSSPSPTDNLRSDAHMMFMCRLICFQL